MRILTGGQFRELDSYTIEHEPIASIDLMERAARAITDALLKRFGHEHRFVIFSGPGGNGGDGLAVARLLAAEGGDVEAFLFNVTGQLNPDCATNLERLRQEENVLLREITSEFTFPDLRSSDIIIDALFGTGLSKPLSGGFAMVTKRINQMGSTVVAIDVPSGMMCEDNAYNDSTVIIRAKLTLTLQTVKLAFLFPENEKFVGEVQRLDIGLSKEGEASLKTHLWLTEPEDVRPLLRSRSRFAHKGTMGHALLVAGSRGMAGAAILAARAAFRSGVGKVSVHTPYANNDILQISVPEAIMEMDIDQEYISSAIDASNYQAIGIGPGLGQNRYTEVPLHDYITQQAAPMVLDADALNLLAEHREWLADLPTDCILTPHPKELERLVGHCANSYDRMNRARGLAISHHCFVILKGHYTMVCAPTGEVFFNTTGNPGMATAGSGDVLTGILTSLLAQGYLSSEAAILGVWLHGLAADIAASTLSEESLTASDIINHLPHAFRSLKGKREGKRGQGKRGQEFFA